MKKEIEDWKENVQMLTDSIGAVVPQDGSVSRIRDARHVEAGFDISVWQTMAEMGWLAIILDEASGGLGLGLREATALFKGLGQGLTPEPLTLAILALRLMAEAGETSLIDEALSGEKIILSAWQASPDSVDPSAGVSVKDALLFGKKIGIDGGLGAHIFVVTTPHGICIIPKNSEGLTVSAKPMHDGTFATQLIFDGVKVSPIPCANMERCLFEAQLMHAAYLLGLSERAFEITLEYLKLRKQFGVAIGSFQALQHRATEIKIRLELSRTSIAAAACAMDTNKKNKPVQMAVLRASTRVKELTRLIAREAVQMHGAIGYTDEADIGLYVRKAMTAVGQYGPEYRLRANYMTLREELD